MGGMPVRVAVLAPMPLELDAVVSELGLEPTGHGWWAGRLGPAIVVGTHIGMGPPRARRAVTRLLEGGAGSGEPVDHVMIAGICGGLDPQLPVGTVVNPRLVVDEATGRRFEHRPPAGGPPEGTLVTTSGVVSDPEASRRLFEQGGRAVDMESAAVAEVCESFGVAWSVYRCISDRVVDGLLDDRVVAVLNPDGSFDTAGVDRLVADHPEMEVRLERLVADMSMAARRAAEAVRAGCAALAERA